MCSSFNIISMDHTKTIGMAKDTKTIGIGKDTKSIGMAKDTKIIGMAKDTKSIGMARTQNIGMAKEGHKNYWHEKGHKNCGLAKEIKI